MCVMTVQNSPSINWRVAYRVVCRVLTCLKNIYIINLGLSIKSILFAIQASVGLIDSEEGARFF